MVDSGGGGKTAPPRLGAAQSTVVPERTAQTPKQMASEIRAPDHLPYWLNFISNMASSLSWPIVVLILVLTFRMKIVGLLEKIDWIKYPGGEASFSNQIVGFRSAVNISKYEAADVIAAAERAKTGQVKNDTAEREIASALAEVGSHFSLDTPRVWAEEGGIRPGVEAILDGWAKIESALQNAAGNREPKSSPPSAALRFLESNRFLTPTTLEAVRRARDLRNAVVHKGKRPSESEALLYWDAATRLADTILAESRLAKATSRKGG